MPTRRSAAAHTLPFWLHAHSTARPAYTRTTRCACSVWSCWQPAFMILHVPAEMQRQSVPSPPPNAREY